MDPRRRSTMQPIDSNIRSGIPMPSTVAKPPPAARLSLAGPAIRAPYPVPPSTNPRHSLYRSQNSNPLLQSSSKANPYGKTPLSNSAARRDSLWPRGAPVAAPSGSQVAKDPRPLRDKGFQQKERQDILEYLKGAGLDINMQRLANIQSKDYRAIFEYLVQCLDPAQAIDSSNGRFEEGFINALKALKYPYIHQIDSKWLAAPASLHTWPMLLGVLHWLVELCKMRDHYMASGHPTLQDPENIPEEFEDQIDHRALAFEYYERSYIVWLDGADDFVEPKRIIEERYARKNERVQQDLESKTRQYHDAKLEYKKLKSSAAPVAELQANHATLLSDREKFERVLEQYESRMKKILEQISYAEADFKQRDDDLHKLHAEQDRLTGIVKEQNLTPEEATRMTTDYDNLSRNLEDLKQKIADSQRAVLSLEVNLSNRAGAAEEIVDQYTGLLSALNLFPPLPPPLQDIDLTLELNTAVSNLQELLTGADIRKIIKPTLSNIAESKRSERASVENDRLRVDNDLDQLTVECENVDSEIAVVEKKVLAINEQAEDLHNAAQQEALMASQEAERLERDLAHARTAALANGMGVKSRLQTLQFQYKEQVEKVNRLKEETIRAIIKNSHDIAVFKAEVSQHLRELRECAESG
ncbi:hypothetical protein K435DRAFT_777030 [Dendrothele bispora CBS 962.96]|uniref:Kinetochore protein NDC80 n=1 Tax=Dendrothele bispora (strain CBS 962.96) TaxID=1314807 RepID=A0A4S8MBJ1_DENBC|nr:hypothetical protein K435DRAFT_777030 [Dendrothele bispora CBS 962.96]